MLSTYIKILGEKMKMNLVKIVFVQCKEDTSQESPSKQVSQGSQVRYGSVVRIYPTLPEFVD